jgi:purine-binding chemotaxis protein CheW
MLGDLFFGIAVHHVQEVLEEQPMTIVPLAAPEVCGLINLRGQIVTAVDLRTCLGRSGQTNRAVSPNIILQYENEFWSLVVDQIGDVVSIDCDRCAPPPESLSSDCEDLIESTIEMDDRLLLILNTTRLFERISGRELVAHE